MRSNPVAESLRVHFSAIKRRLPKAKSATLIMGSPFKAQLIGDHAQTCFKRADYKKDTVEKKRNINSEPQLNRRKVNRKVTSTKATSSCENDVEENNACGNCGFTYMGNKMTH